MSFIPHTLLLCSDITDLVVGEGSFASEGPGCVSHTLSVANNGEITDS